MLPRRANRDIKRVSHQGTNQAETLLSDFFNRFCRGFSNGFAILTRRVTDPNHDDRLGCEHGCGPTLNHVACRAATGSVRRWVPMQIALIPLPSLAATKTLLAPPKRNWFFLLIVFG